MIDGILKAGPGLKRLRGARVTVRTVDTKSVQSERRGPAVLLGEIAIQPRRCIERADGVGLACGKRFRAAREIVLEEFLVLLRGFFGAASGENVENAYFSLLSG